MRFAAWVAVVLASSIIALPQVAQAKRVALVVGINRYDNLPRERQLAKAVNDARAVEATLRSVGFDVIRVEDVGRSAFNLAWQQLLNKVGPGDEVAMYFSGHGVEIDGVNYLVPRDIPAVSTGEIRRLKNEALSFDEIRRDLAAHGPKLSLFILDACRDNPFADDRGRSIGGSKGLVPVQAEYGSFIMFAAGAREMALDRLNDTDQAPNSVYTRKLVPLLMQPGLRLPDLAQRVRNEVRQLANSVGHRQNPAYYDEGADDVCLAGCAPTPAATPLQPSTSEAERAWAAAKETTSIAALEAFIRRFGDTYYGDLAKVRLAELKRAEEARKKAEEERTLKEAERQREAMLERQRQDEGRKAAEAKDRRAPKAESPGISTALTAASLRGRWNGSLNCPDGRWDLHFDIRENSASSFGGYAGPEGEKIVNGMLSGSRVSFVTQHYISRSWSGIVSQTGGTLRMQGSHHADWGTKNLGAGNCTFSL